MGTSRFVAPRVVSNFGEVQRALSQIQQSTDLLSRSGYVIGLQTQNFTLVAGTFVRVSPPVAGVRAVLPAAGAENAASTIVVALEGVRGNFTVFAAPGQTINGAATSTFNVEGIVEIFSNGVDAWTSTSQLPGLNGLPGPSGASGVQGPMGLSGLDGSDGRDGNDGMPGQPGAAGAPGANGAPGLGLAGLDGADGFEGLPGMPGQPGLPGVAGADGLPGLGLPGLDGLAGLDGADGMRGLDGAAGAAGAQGLNGFSGADGMSGQDGSDGMVIQQVVTSNNVTPPAGIVLSATTHSLELVTSAAGDVHSVTSYAVIASGTGTPGSQTDRVTTATTTTVVGAPGPSNQVVLLSHSLFNVGTATNTLTVQKNNAGSLRTLFSAPIGAGERVEYTPDRGWRVFDTFGREKTAKPGSLTSGNAITVGSAVDLTGSTSTINITPTAGSLGVVDISTLLCGGVLTFQSVTEATIDGFTAKTDGFFFFCHVRDATTGAVIKLLEDNGAPAATGIRTPDIRDLRLYKNDSVLLFYSNSRWRSCQVMPRLFLTGVDTVTFAAQEDNHARTSSGQNRMRVTLTGNQTLTGVVPDSSANGSPNGEILIIENVDGVDTLTVRHDDGATSTAANRFALPDGLDYLIGPRAAGIFAYDDTSARWRLIGSSGLQSGRLLRRTTILAPGGTHNYLSGTKSVIQYIQSAGGGGGGVARIATANSGAGGGGGGAGGLTVYEGAPIGASTTVTVTSGGAGGVGNANGSAGGNSSTSEQASVGGSGGIGTGASTGQTFCLGGAGGTGTYGGAAGGYGWCPSPAFLAMAFTGAGASSRFGGGGNSLNPFPSVGANGNAATGFGAGGGGAQDLHVGASAAANLTGGAGSSGIVIIEEYS